MSLLLFVFFVTQLMSDLLNMCPDNKSDVIIPPASSCYTVHHYTLNNTTTHEAPLLSVQWEAKHILRSLALSEAGKGRTKQSDKRCLHVDSLFKLMVSTAPIYQRQ